MYKLQHSLRRIEERFWKKRRNSLAPSIFQHDYLHHVGLVKQVCESILIIKAKSRKARNRILDVGCGDKPYLKLFEPLAKKYTGVDIAAQAADVVASADDLPFVNNRFDIVVCFQVLEHLAEPNKAIAEMYRVVRKGGFVVLSTHGAWMYHPCPHDYFRWTGEGLKKLFRQFTYVSVAPTLPWLPSIFQLINIELYSLACRYWLWKLPLYGLITLLNISGKIFISAGMSHFTINYVVTGQK